MLDASHWINHPKARHYVVTEDSIRVNSGLVLTLLWWEDEQQLLDLADEDEQDESDQDPFDFA